VYIYTTGEKPMQDATTLWARVLLSSENKVSEYALFANEKVESGELVSSGMGGEWFNPPIPASALPRPLSDPLILVLMHGASIDGIGMWLREPEMQLSNVVWLHNITLTHSDLREYIRRETWQQKATVRQQKVAQELLSRLRPAVDYIKVLS
jgi:hypothetical protein